MVSIPIGLYVHLPWCIKKCPYCDFNSHVFNQNNNIKNKDIESKYLDYLIEDLKSHLPSIWGRSFKTIFFGGGTPSLFSPEFYYKLINTIRSLIVLKPDAEITMEANPGARECGDFKAYKDAGITRISLGVQSFQDKKLKSLGRIHHSDHVYQAIENIQSAQFNSWNIDLMHGLPNQSIDDALYDLDQAIRFNSPHLSWYQLTLEPNTVFYKQPPILPNEHELEGIETQGFKKLSSAGLNRYEISAFSKSISHQSQHNLLYWSFADYLGIGAGAHSKLTDFSKSKIYRIAKYKRPERYMSNNLDFISSQFELNSNDQIFEFMLNNLRCVNGFNWEDFETRTYLEPNQYNQIKINCEELIQKKLLTQNPNSPHQYKPTELGLRFYNDLVNMFSEL